MIGELPLRAMVVFGLVGLGGVACAPLPIAASGPGDCREFQAPVTAGGKTTTQYSLQCLQADGTWKLLQTSATPLPLPQPTYPPALAYDPEFYVGGPAYGAPYGYGYDPFFVGPTVGFGFGYGDRGRGGFDRGGFDRGGFDRGGFNRGGGNWRGGNRR